MHAQFMADLLEVRVVPEKPPFAFVDVDYFGPLEVKQERSRVKRYGCLFTCLTTRCAHRDSPLLRHRLND